MEFNSAFKGLKLLKPR